MTKHRILTVALVSALAPVALTTPVAASVSSADTAQPTAFSLGTRPCFLVRTPWNVALDGQRPRCG